MSLHDNASLCVDPKDAIDVSILEQIGAHHLPELSSDLAEARIPLSQHETRGYIESLLAKDLEFEVFDDGLFRCGRRGDLELQVVIAAAESHQRKQEYESLHLGCHPRSGSHNV